MKDIVIIEESSVTARGYRHRTTVPAKVFGFLKLKDKDVLKWFVDEEGTVTLKKAAKLPLPK